MGNREKLEFPFIEFTKVTLMGPEASIVCSCGEDTAIVVHNVVDKDQCGEGNPDPGSEIVL